MKFMALTGTIFQRSNQVKLDRTIQETWTTELGMISTTLMDSLGVRSRVLQVKITNPTNLMESAYIPMQRVRLLDDWGLVTFLGRIVSIDPDYPNRQLVVISWMIWRIGLLKLLQLGLKMGRHIVVSLI